MMERFLPAAKPPVRARAQGGMDTLRAGELRRVCGGPIWGPTCGQAAAMRPLAAAELRHVAGGPVGGPTCIDGH